MRGGSTLFRLQKPTEAQTATLADTTAWEDVCEFRGTLAPLSAIEYERFGREVAERTLKCEAMYRDIATQNAAEVVENNRIVVMNKDNDLDPEDYDITGVDRRRSRSGRRIVAYTIFLRRIQ